MQKYSIIDIPNKDKNKTSTVADSDYENDRIVDNVNNTPSTFVKTIHYLNLSFTKTMNS